MSVKTIPPKLKSGDKVAIVTTAKRVLADDIVPAVNLLKKWGLNVVTGDYVYAADNYLGGTDQQRSTDLQKMIDDQEVKAIFCSRGGYGTTRIIDHLNFSPLRENPKWIVGFSDITTLLIHLQKIDIASLHAPMPFQYGNSKYSESLAYLKKALFDEPCAIKFQNNTLNNTGKAEGLVVGGNLSILTNLIGTPSDVNYDGKILFIEEVEEYFYKIDRMMIHLKRSEKLKNLAGLVVGHMTNMMDNETPYGKSAYEIIAEVVNGYAYPLYFEAPVGHEDPNLPVPVGLNSTIAEVEGEWVWHFRQ